jgi:hypothetical protein
LEKVEREISLFLGKRTRKVRESSLRAFSGVENEKVFKNENLCELSLVLVRKIINIAKFLSFSFASTHRNNTICLLISGDFACTGFSM